MAPFINGVYTNRYDIKTTIMRRDGISAQEADELIAYAKADVEAGCDPEEVLFDYFGLEPDYIFDILPF